MFKFNSTNKTLLSDSRIQLSAFISGIILVLSLLIFSICYFLSVSNIWLSPNQVNYVAQLELSFEFRANKYVVKSSGGYHDEWSKGQSFDIIKLKKHLSDVNIHENITAALTRTAKANTFILSIKVDPVIEYGVFKEIISAVQSIKNHKYRVAISDGISVGSG